VRISAAPDLVVEILSPGTETLDRVTKRRIYALHGVKEPQFKLDVTQLFAL
jgi:Uma2 family endonuclease